MSSPSPSTTTTRDTAKFLALLETLQNRNPIQGLEKWKSDSYISSRRPVSQQKSSARDLQDNKFALLSAEARTKKIIEEQRQEQKFDEEDERDPSKYSSSTLIDSDTPTSTLLARIFSRQQPRLKLPSWALLEHQEIPTIESIRAELFPNDVQDQKLREEKMKLLIKQSEQEDERRRKIAPAPLSAEDMRRRLQVGVKEDDENDKNVENEDEEFLSADDIQRRNRRIESEKLVKEANELTAKFRSQFEERKEHFSQRRQYRVEQSDELDKVGKFEEAEKKKLIVASNAVANSTSTNNNTSLGTNDTHHHVDAHAASATKKSQAEVIAQKYLGKKHATKFQIAKAGGGRVSNFELIKRFVEYYADASPSRVRAGEDDGAVDISHVSNDYHDQNEINQIEAQVEEAMTPQRERAKENKLRRQEQIRQEMEERRRKVVENVIETMEKQIEFLDKLLSVEDTQEIANEDDDAEQQCLRDLVVSAIRTKIFPGRSKEAESMLISDEASFAEFLRHYDEYHEFSNFKEVEVKLCDSLDRKVSRDRLRILRQRLESTAHEEEHQRKQVGVEEELERLKWVDLERNQRAIAQRAPSTSQEKSQLLEKLLLGDDDNDSQEPSSVEEKQHDEEDPEDEEEEENEFSAPQNIPQLGENDDVPIQQPQPPLPQFIFDSARERKLIKDSEEEIQENDLDSSRSVLLAKNDPQENRRLKKILDAVVRDEEIVLSGRVSAAKKAKNALVKKEEEIDVSMSKEEEEELFCQDPMLVSKLSLDDQKDLSNQQRHMTWPTKFRSLVGAPVVPKPLLRDLKQDEEEEKNNNSQEEFQQHQQYHLARSKFRFLEALSKQKHHHQMRVAEEEASSENAAATIDPGEIESDHEDSQEQINHRSSSSQQHNSASAVPTFRMTQETALASFTPAPSFFDALSARYEEIQRTQIEDEKRAQKERIQQLKLESLHKKNKFTMIASDGLPFTFEVDVDEVSLRNTRGTRRAQVRSKLLDELLTKVERNREALSAAASNKTRFK